MSVGIIGAGAFGTALAIALGQRHQVTLWARNTDQAVEMERSRRGGPRLPDAILPSNVRVTGRRADLSSCAVVILAIPMQKLRETLPEHARMLADLPLVACCKGVELNTGLGATALMTEVLPGNANALLTGPSFATDLAMGLPTALTLACSDDGLGEWLQGQLSVPSLRVYRTTDTIGAELGGALKNVIAIGCGAIMGAGLGESARAALMTRGYAEMQRYALSKGARPETLAGLSGFGDLALTCTSVQSRNTRFGFALARQELFDPNQTVEGAPTARAVADEAAQAGIDMPITTTILRLIDQEITIQQAAAALLSRPLKEETPC